MQDVAAQKHSGAFLHLERNDLFHIPSGILSYAPGRFQPTFIQAENLNPNLQQNKSHLYPSRTAFPGDSAVCKALWAAGPIPVGKDSSRIFTESELFPSQKYTSTTHTKLLCSNLGFPYLGDRPNSNANSN